MTGTHSKRRWRGIAAALAVMCAMLVVRLKPGTPAVPASATLEPNAASSIDRTLECERQAARLATWRGRGAGGTPVDEPAWLGHYSGRDDVCYAAMAGSVAVTDGEPPLVTELWNAFEATRLASFTSDGRADMRRDFCRIDVAENPFTSCLVAEFFIRQHLAN